MIDFLLGPWPWWFSGLMIVFVMFLLVLGGKSFGFSSNLRTLCAAAGAGKTSDFFRFDWKAERWNLAFAAGALMGGAISVWGMGGAERVVALSDAAKEGLVAMGLTQNAGLLPTEIFGEWSPGRVLLWLLAGFLVGFGSRWAGGCTSGHAISGLSNLQLPSLIAVMGFFAGGLVMTWFLAPILIPFFLSF
jgi:uncharacterized membrane protein YedE/YeeE